MFRFLSSIGLLLAAFQGTTYDYAPTAILLAPSGAAYVANTMNAAQVTGPTYDNGPAIIPLCAIVGTSPVKYAACPAAGPYSTIAQHTPATSSEACSTGQVAGDTNFLYSCVAPNTWKRTALSAF